MVPFFIVTVVMFLSRCCCCCCCCRRSVWLQRMSVVLGYQLAAGWVRSRLCSLARGIPGDKHTSVQMTQHPLIWRACHGITSSTCCAVALRQTAAVQLPPQSRCDERSGEVSGLLRCEDQRPWHPTQPPWERFPVGLEYGPACPIFSISQNW